MLKRKQQAQLEEAFIESESAINMFNSAIDKLTNANAKLDEVKEEIASSIIQLENKLNVVAEKYKENTKTIQNIKDIIGG